MKNLYDIRKKEELLYVLSKDVTAYDLKDELASSVAIAVNLYYEEMSDLFFSYLAAIPEKIQIYIISSNPLILDAASIYFKGKKNVILLKKENRGRDISALLVTFREIAFQYQYICFIHDKRAKHSFLENDINFWTRNLWENVIGSWELICNIFEIFENNAEIGLLVPPEPIGDHTNAWFENAWYGNYKLTYELAEKLQLKCNIDEEKSPITLGSVFWAKTCAIEKLLKREWAYDDFQEEPLPNGRTISHAIERIIGYVAQDAGYKTGTIMTNTYSASMLLYLQDSMTQIAKVFKNKLSIHTLNQIKQLDNQKEQIILFFAHYQKVYLYGAGMFGKELLENIREWNLEPTGFIVSDGKRDCDNINNLSVYELHEIEPSRETGIVISVNFELQKEMEETLQIYGHANYIMGYF